VHDAVLVELEAVAVVLEELCRRGRRGREREIDREREREQSDSQLRSEAGSVREAGAEGGRGFIISFIMLLHL
jgi:hypothetical protein